MKTGYVVQKIGYEYNDEIYHTSEYDGFSKSVEVFLDENKANEQAKQRNIAEFRGNDIGHYCYGLDEIINEEDLADFIQEGVLEGESWDCSVSQYATDEQIERLMSKIDLKFYRVEEVPIYDA